jgi:hypothetical protein
MWKLTLGYGSRLDRYAVGIITKSSSVAEGQQGFHLHTVGLNVWTQNLTLRPQGPRRGLYHQSIISSGV